MLVCGGQGCDVSRRHGHNREPRGDTVEIDRSGFLVVIGHRLLLATAIDQFIGRLEHRPLLLAQREFKDLGGAVEEGFGLSGSPWTGDQRFEIAIREKIQEAAVGTPTGRVAVVTIRGHGRVG